ncbi:hypothetical protein SBRCBS47491_009842 [Sporothrix bragantina]|uniref:Uncharacterized protein n=1 Tax=Sporothrix bragantina TaxID=671064 RepID=A0ABP0CYM3_9PEZI
MEAAPPESPTTSIATTAQVHADIDLEEDRAVVPSAMDQARADTAREFKENVNSACAAYCKLHSWNVGLEKKVQELWTYGRDMYNMYTAEQRQLVQVYQRLKEAEEVGRRFKEELSRCRRSWEQESQTTVATMRLLESDCDIYKDGAEVLAKTVDRKDSEIKRLTDQLEELEAKFAGQEAEHVQLTEQNKTLQKDLAEARDLLQAMEAPAEPQGRVARKKRKL